MSVFDFSDGQQGLEHFQQLVNQTPFILKYNYLFWLFTVVPFKIDLTISSERQKYLDILFKFSLACSRIEMGIFDWTRP